MRLAVFIALAFCAYGQTFSSTASPSGSRSSLTTRSSSRSSINSRSPSVTPTSSASPTFSRSSQPSKSPTASSNATMSSRPSKSSSASPSFSKSPRPSVLVNSISSSQSALPSTTPSPQVSKTLSPSALPSYSAQASFSTTPTQTPTPSATHTPFCPAGLEKFFFTDVEYCNGKDSVTIEAGAFFSAVAIYGAYLIPASCISCCVASRYNGDCCNNRTTCFSITSIIFPPFIAFVMLYMGGFWMYIGYFAICRNASRVYNFVFPPPPPPPPQRPNPCFPRTDCGICAGKHDNYIMLRCGHMFGDKCILTWRNGTSSNRLECPTCRIVDQNMNPTTFTASDIERFAREDEALKAEKASKIAAAAAAYAARVEAQAPTLAIRIEQ